MGVRSVLLYKTLIVFKGIFGLIFVFLKIRKLTKIARKIGVWSWSNI